MKELNKQQEDFVLEQRRENEFCLSDKFDERFKELDHAMRFINNKIDRVRILNVWLKFHLDNKEFIKQIEDNLLTTIISVASKKYVMEIIKILAGEKLK